MRLFISVAAAAIAVAPALAGSQAISGSWSGEMRQVDPTQETKYPMTLALAGAKGKSSYPTLNCGGAWSRIGQTEEGYAIYKETAVNQPEGHCIDGVVIVYPDAGKLVLGWFASFEGTPSLASAVLSKEAK